MLILRAELEAYTQGNSYSTISNRFDAGGDCGSTMVGTYVSKYDATGNHRGSFDLGTTVDDYGEYPSAVTGVDGNGNVYAGLQRADFDSSECNSSNEINVVAKYSTNGALLWLSTSTVGTPKGITVSSSSVYVVGNQGMARYTSSGNLTWTKPGNFEEVIVSGSNLYTRYRKDIRKYDGTGKQLWLKTQSGLNTIVLQDMDDDGNGNVYLSGKYDAGGGNFNAMTRKLNARGSVLWTKTYGTPAYDDARGIATITGSAIYTTGETQGSLTHTNKGGRDSYIRK